MIFPAPKNANYAATVVAINTLVELPKCDNVRAAIIFGNSVIISKEVQAGELGLYFPPETQLSKEFLSANNLYRKPELGNIDPEQKGFFEEHGRVKTMKFRGHKSEGFWIPITSLEFTNIPLKHLAAGDSFDHIGSIEICRKYLPKTNRVAGKQNGEQRGKAKTAASNIIEGQFAFHRDTENLRRNSHKVQPDDIISITDKWHGTSIVISRIMVKRNLSTFERVLSKFGVKIVDRQYGYTYSSRKVIKAAGDGVWTDDIWGVVAKEIEDRVPNGFTLYGEVVGFTPEGAAIQEGYSYECEPRKHRLLIYRVTVTTTDNVVVELTWSQIVEFCAKYGLESVKEIYSGKAGQWLGAFLDETDESWQGRFLRQLEGVYVNDADCAYNPKGTPAEGIVLRIYRLHEAEALKLKNFRFLEAESKSLDKGVVDTETAQSEPEEEAA